jgi:mono/diheme cytochrome c family protein
MSKLAAFVFGGIVAVVLCLAAATVFVRHAARGFSAREQPTQMEAMLANTARNAAMPAALRDRTSPVAPSAEALQEGMAHYADHCAVCHANNGSGETMMGGGMYPKPPDLRQPETQVKTDGELFGIIENGIRLSGMPAFGGNGSAQAESWNLVLFLRHLQALTPAEEQAMQHLNPKSPAEMDEEKQEQDFLNGVDPAPATKKP